MNRDVVTSQKVIVALGGQSYPGCGTTGEGYEIARQFGHEIVEPQPALVPLLIGEDWVAGLRGITMPDVEATIHDTEGRRVIARREAILFAHFGLTGPAILDVSRAVARDSGNRMLLGIDLVPGRQREDLEHGLQVSSRDGRKPVASLLPSEIPRRLAEALMESSGLPAERLGPDLTRDERRRLVTSCKDLRLRVNGTRGFAKAEVTSGGVSLDEVDSETLQSRIQPGLFFAGEVLDLDGFIGGYNFQAAWSTGWLAGEASAMFDR
ncbi:MAG: hypothetical protein NVSMB9_35230 [Isosphaeraceae bacterium]